MTPSTAARVGELRFDPQAPEFIRDPHVFYDRCRAVEPVFRTEAGEWLLTRHEDVALVLRDRRFIRDFRKGRRPETLREPVNVAMSRMLPYLNPPEHTRVRAVVQQGFLARYIDALKPVIQGIADDLIAAAQARGRMDLVEDFALPLPLIVICEMLGIPEPDRGIFFDPRLRSDGRALEAAPMTRDELSRANGRTRQLEEYFVRLLERRRRDPASNLASLLAQAAHADGRLSAQELVSNIVFLFGAGHETTANLIGNSLVALENHPRELARVKAEPAAIADGVDELVRYGGSIQFVARVAATDVILGGKTVSQGDIVIACLAAGNRDPAVFAQPHRLDLCRRRVRPLSFGGGIHYCLGTQLARLELEIALRTLYRRLPNLRLAYPDDVSWKRSFVLRGPQSLPARW